MIVSVIAGAVASMFLVRSAVGGAGPAESIIIKVDGTVHEELPLAEDRVVRIKARSGFCDLEIRDGHAKITNADCPKKLCTTQMPIGDAGGVIVCLPHKIVISARGADDGGGEIDTIVR